MALNAAQIARRHGLLTGSRIGCIMRGDREEILRLYEEFIGETLPLDLSDNWPVQLGSLTEQLNLDWYERKSGNGISRRGDFVRHPTLPWAGVTLDGWVAALQCPIEAKHVGGREPIEVIIDRYQPQLQLTMEVTGADECALSVIMGAAEPVVDFIPRDEEYAAEMIARGTAFMLCVKSRTPPVELPAVPAPADAQAVYDMDGNNQWANLAVEWLNTRAAAKTNEDAAKQIKLLVPADAHRCDGYGVYIIRNRAGTLSLRELRK